MLFVLRRSHVNAGKLVCLAETSERGPSRPEPQSLASWRWDRETESERWWSGHVSRFEEEEEEEPVHPPPRPGKMPSCIEKSGRGAPTYSMS
eukprot:3208976-Prymnesium_polylepis.1